jgi:peptidoglycan/xylan/chitin deacetylase (PgdA/CDA1 family)
MHMNLSPIATPKGVAMQKSHRLFSPLISTTMALLALCILLAPLLTLSRVVDWSSLAQPQAAAAHPLVRSGDISPLASAANAPNQARAVPALAATVVAAPSAAPPAGDITHDMRLLVLAGDGSEAALRAITQTLDYLGTPYTVRIATQHPEGLTTAELFSGRHSHYQGVMLTSDTLPVTPDNGVTWHSALTDAEWETLWRYEATFGLRQAIWYTEPSVIFGLGLSTEVNTSSTPITATLTAAGSSVFSYLRHTARIPIRGVQAYLAPVASKNTRPLLVDAHDNALAAIRTFPDGRQNLLLMFDNDPSLVHTLALAYGVVDWVMRGLFLGERHISLSAQVDDVFIPNEIWSPGTPCASGIGGRPSGVTYRISGDDLRAVVAWQQRVRAKPTTRDLRLNMAFNGLGTTSFGPRDTLIQATRQLQANFAWVSHTYSHLKLDAMDYQTAADEIRWNNTAAAELGLSLYNPATLITPEVSGLANSQFLQAAQDQGIRYLVSDTSKADQANPRPNAGRLNQYQSSILEIPRRPNGLDYNVSQPDEWIAEYNCLSRSDRGRGLTYAEMLDTESDVLLQYMLRGELDPWMFHQANLRAYDGAHSLLSDLLDRTLAKYNQLFTLPIASPTMDELGIQIANRMQYDDADVTASITHSNITLTAQHDAVVPITGLRTSEAEYYDTEYIAHIALKAGQSVTLPIP